MQPSAAWRTLLVALGFLFVFLNAVPATYLPGLDNSLVHGPLAILFLANMGAGMMIMAYGLISPTVMLPEWSPKREPEQDAQA